MGISGCVGDQQHILTQLNYQVLHLCMIIQ
jgi:hypothetical protein